MSEQASLFQSPLVLDLLSRP
ncbi:BnaAnng11950D [Brassica napus]|uniref:BnaAnng11950D protein n=1 Tax=Brassica napus TaxID=3708 RepID=A0A078ITI8_BRANA|nr:BnaAnng11950D [Brassica napus]